MGDVGHETQFKMLLSHSELTGQLGMAVAAFYVDLNLLLVFELHKLLKHSLAVKAGQTVV
jgi:hypothetical protein